MAFEQFTFKKLEALSDQFVEKRRPPANLRDQVDLSFRIEGQSIVIFEIRPVWNEPEKKIESMVAKATFVKSTKHWKIYWQKSDLKWHPYEPDREVEHFEEFLKIVDKDECGCFWG